MGGWEISRMGDLGITGPEKWSCHKTLGETFLDQCFGLIGNTPCMVRFLPGHCWISRTQSILIVGVETWVILSSNWASQRCFLVWIRWKFATIYCRKWSWLVVFFHLRASIFKCFKLAASHERRMTLSIAVYLWLYSKDIPRLHSIMGHLSSSHVAVPTQTLPEPDLVHRMPQGYNEHHHHHHGEHRP